MKSETQRTAGQVLPLDERTKRLLQEVAGLLVRHREGIAKQWIEAYLSSPGRLPQLTDEEAGSLIRRVLDLWLDNVKRGDFDAYYRALAQTGRDYVRLGISYSNLLLAAHLYEEVIDPILTKERIKQDKLLEYFLAIDRLNHNALAILASSYFEFITEDLRERNRQLSVINSISTTVSQTLELQQVLETALDKLIENLGFAYAEIFLLDETRQRLYPRAHRGISLEFARELESFKVGEGLPGIVAQTGKPLFIAELERDPRFLRRLAGRQKLKSGLGIPLIAHKRVVGVMNIFSESAEPPTESDLQLLNAVGSQIGIAIENASLYQQLQERAEELAEANRRREQFISLVAHEFREPLTVIIGYGQMLGRLEPKDKVTSQRVAETIVSQAKRLARLVDDLQDVSQIETGRFEIARERFDLVELATEIVRAQQATTDKHKLVLQAPDHPVEGQWDRDRIAQVLVNLLSNAIKYSPGGGKITVSIEPQNHDVSLTVRDQGIGIAREDFPQLFLPYSKLYRRQPVKGTGLGLFITRGIVQAHGGSIWVESEVGKGTAFHLTLPRDGRAKE